MELEPEPEPLAEPEPAATCAEIGSSSSTHSGDEESAADFSPDERFELDSSCFGSGSESDEGTTVSYLPVPVAQAAVAYIVPSNMTARALGRVSAFAQLGVIIGPASSGTLQFLFGTVGGWLGLSLQPDVVSPLGVTA